MSENNSSWYQRPDMLVGLSAVLVSLVALSVGIYSAYIDRNAAKASVWPSLMLGPSFNQDSFKLLVLNQGTGPAIIKHASIKMGGKPMHTWRDVLDGVGIKNTPYFQSHIGAGVIRPGQTVVSFEISAPEHISKLSKIDGFEYEICYCSIYKDCWVASIDTTWQQVPQCEINPAERFKQ